MSKITDREMVFAALEALAASHGNRLNSAIVVKEAERYNSPLHDEFEWDDTEAGKRYRLLQAGMLIRTWKGVVVKVDTQARTVAVKATRRMQSTTAQRRTSGGGWEDTAQILADPIKKNDMLQTVLRELASYRRRYADLAALSEVWQAVDTAMELHAESSPKRGRDDGVSAVAP